MAINPPEDLARSKALVAAFQAGWHPTIYLNSVAAPVPYVQAAQKAAGDAAAVNGIISVAYSGSDRKTLYAVARDNAQNKDWIIALPMTAQGPKGRGK